MANLFTEDQVQQLNDEFPDRGALAVVDQINRLADSESIRSPMGLARSWLGKRTPVGGSSPARSRVPQTPQARGTFRPDGSWNRYANKPSATERDLREFGVQVLTLRLSPAEAVDLATAPNLVRCFRNTTLASMAQLDGRPPEPPDPRHLAELLAWLEAAWRAVTTCTTAEEWVKRRIVDGLAPVGPDAVTTEDPDAWRAETSAEGS